MWVPMRTCTSRGSRIHDPAQILDILVLWGRGLAVLAEPRISIPLHDLGHKGMVPLLGSCLSLAERGGDWVSVRFQFRLLRRIIRKNCRYFPLKLLLIPIIGIFYPAGELISLQRLRCSPLAVVHYSFMGHFLATAAISTRE